MPTYRCAELQAAHDRFHLTTIPFVVMEFMLMFSYHGSLAHWFVTSRLAAPDSCDRPPEEGGELDEPALDVAVVESQLQLCKQLCCVQQGHIGWQDKSCDIVPVACDSCRICSHSMTQFSRLCASQAELLGGTPHFPGEHHWQMVRWQVRICFPSTDRSKWLASGFAWGNLEPWEPIDHASFHALAQWACNPELS